MLTSKLYRICSRNLRSVLLVPNGRQLHSHTESPSQLEPDPFGLSESELDLPTIVQGEYAQAPTPKQTSSTPNKNYSALSPISTGPASTDSEHEPSTRANYEKWVQKRIPKAIRFAEKIYPANFGEIRFDSENIVKYNGQFEDIEVDEVDEFNNLLPIDETDQNQKYPLDQLKEEKRQAKAEKEEIEVNRKVPSIYVMPDYNRLTKDDMWNILKRSIIYENSFMFAINKPYGISMHSSSIECRHFIIEFLENFAKFVKVDEVYPLHRLDKATTGVLLFAKTGVAASVIKEKFASSTIKKKYLTVTKNSPSLSDGTIDIPIAEGKVGGTENYRSVLKPNLRKFGINSSQASARKAVTHFKVINSYNECSFLEVNPETGVKHQIRIHLGMGLGCPILGDHKYSHREKLAPQRLSNIALQKLKVSQSKVRELPLHLHCSSVEFTVPKGISDSANEQVFVHTRPPRFFMHTVKTLGLK